MRPFRRRSGPMLTPLARLSLAAALVAGFALMTALASVDAGPGGEGDILPPLSYARGQDALLPRPVAGPTERSH